MTQMNEKLAYKTNFVCDENCLAVADGRLALLPRTLHITIDPYTSHIK